MAIKVLFLVAIVAFAAAAVNGRILPADRNAADLQTEFYPFHFPRHGGFRGGAGIGFGGVPYLPIGRPRTGGFIGRGGGSGFDGGDGAGTGDDGSLKKGGGAVDGGVEGGLMPSIEKSD